MTKFRFAVALTALSVMASVAQAQVIGSVDTAWNMLGSNHKVEVLAFDDPKVQGATCFLSRPVTGGIGGAIGLAEDKSDVSIACRAVGPLKITTQFGANEQVFDESRSALFKKLRVVRMWDPKRQVLIYLAYSDKLIDGSPKNSISVVPFR
jgi:CreA protein